MANLKADPVGKDEFRRFRNALVTSSVNQNAAQSRPNPATHIKLGLPFSNPVEIRAAGKFLPFDSGGATVWGFLVTELLDLRTRLIFDQLIIERKNDGQKGSNAGSPDLIDAWNVKPKEPVESEDPSKVTSAGEPVDFLEQLCLEASGDFEAEGLRVIKDPKLVQQYRSCLKSGHDDPEHNGQSTTGDPVASVEGPAPLNLSTSQAPRIPVTLDDFFDALNELAKLGHAFDTIAVSTVFRQREVGSGIVNFFPRLMKNVRSWHLASDQPNAPARGYVVAEQNRGGIWRYLIELERKGQEALSLLYLRDHAGNRIDPRIIYQFMRKVAEENGWSGAEDQYRQWVFQHIKHKPGKGPVVFAQVIAQKLE
jgi:hypothetical protein